MIQLAGANNSSFFTYQFGSKKTIDICKSQNNQIFVDETLIILDDKDLMESIKKSREQFLSNRNMSKEELYKKLGW
jgi:hypothetical protein